MTHSKIKITIRLLVLSAVALQMSCFCAMQSYNQGKILLPGETHMTIGLGQREYYVEEYKPYEYRPGSINYGIENSYETLSVPGVYLAYDYRLGILERRPFGKGLEVGVHIESPLYIFDYEASGTPECEFSGRFGLPLQIAGNLLYHHNVTLGWDVGQWIDNGWFLEYAGGFESEAWFPYFSVRGMLTSTPIQVVENIFNFNGNKATIWDYSHRTFVGRAALGCAILFPKMFLLPDYVMPEISCLFPDWNAPDLFTLSFQCGLRWKNGL